MTYFLENQSSFEEQEERVRKCEQEARQAKLNRDEAKRKVFAAQQSLKKPSVYLPSRHIPALCISGLLALGGIGASLDAREPSAAIFGVGTGAVICWSSSALDDRRQKRVKAQIVEKETQSLSAAENELYSAVLRLVREEEILYCVKTLNIDRRTLESLQCWMANPRTELRNLIIKAIHEIKRIQPEPKNEKLKAKVSEALKKEQSYRELGSRILSEDFQEVKTKIDAQVRKQFQAVLVNERQAALQEIKTTVNKARFASVAVSTTTAASVGIAGAGLAKKAGAGDTVQTAAAVIAGVGALVGLGGILWEVSGMLAQKIQENSQIKDERSFQNAVVAAKDINEILDRVYGEVEPEVRSKNLREVLDKLNIVTKSSVYKQDALLREYTSALTDLLKEYIKQFEKNSFGIFKLGNKT